MFAWIMEEIQLVKPFSIIPDFDLFSLIYMHSLTITVQFVIYKKPPLSCGLLYFFSSPPERLYHWKLSSLTLQLKCLRDTKFLARYIYNWTILSTQKKRWNLSVLFFMSNILCFFNCTLPWYTIYLLLYLLHLIISNSNYENSLLLTSYHLILHLLIFFQSWQNKWEDFPLKDT